MIIRRVRIDSYGALKSRELTFSERTTVFYGKNESGKTTVMQFMRNVFFPSNTDRRGTLYPGSSPSDSGEIVLDEGTLSISHKKVSGDRPEYLAGIDSSVYDKIFAMELDDLRESKVITDGDLNSKFLTIPGGAGMPYAMNRAEKMSDDLIGKRINSPSQLVDINYRLSELESEIDSEKAQADRYGEISRLLLQKEAEAENLKGLAEEEKVKRETINLYKSQQRNFRNYAAAVEEKKELGEFKTVTAEDVERKNSLDSTLNEAVRNRERIEGERKEWGGQMDGIDYQRLLRYRDDILSLKGRIEEREKRMNAPAQREYRTRKIRTVSKPLLIIGILLLLAGAACGVLVTPYAFALSAVGVAIALCSATRTTEITEEIAEQFVITTDTLVDDIKNICHEIGTPFTEMRATAERLNEYLDVAKKLEDESRLNSAMREEMNVRLELSEFLSLFGGADGYESCRLKTDRAKQLDDRISTLDSAIRSAGLDPVSPVCPVEEADDEATYRLDQCNKEIGQLTSYRDSILKMTKLESDMDLLETLESSKENILRMGAVSIIATYLADMACAESVEKVQPNVVNSANRYFGMMVNDAEIRVDPVKKGIFVTVNGHVRSLKEMSSGLKAQVLLSLKLAIAREMGDGRIPVILDDVLLQFDSERKAGAVKALAEVGNEMQIIMFTCDAETRDFCAETDGITLNVLE